MKESRNHTRRAEHIRCFVRRLAKKADAAFVRGDYDTLAVLNTEYFSLYRELVRIKAEPI